MATETKDAPGVIAPPPLIFAAFLLAGWTIDRLLGSLGLPIETPVRNGAAVGLIVLGLLLEMWAGGFFRRAGTNVIPYKPATVLVTDGPYRFSRNPMYVGFTITYLGLAIGLGSRWALLLLPVCLLVMTWGVILREERYLEGKFGQAYLDYRGRVRRWL
ncbi:isoprenylcysteine carboxylmethyltransferase family protein [Brevundimonas sp. 2R-24]|uniref:Isoprenylcysteine carboxylmethyltransferase family protein n=1 Tax=Peiella sedimenti TaxID=3061083 RepID=A0ABT8SL48_9CAUL|nr:isoprenylcysteine carboxylmethyltransferase family protein [Caulobacteraceae bacterium XZ-24]